jgi:hypothetical protein
VPDYRTFRSPHLLSAAMRRFLRTEAGSDFTSLTSLFPPEWNAVVMGGVLRDLLLDHILKIHTKLADVDIVVFGAASVDEVKDKLGKATQSTNAFGGIKCQPRSNGMIFDVWRVEDHTNMAIESRRHDIAQLLRHNLLDVDAILWEPKTDQLHDCGCMNAIPARRIGLMGPQGISRDSVAAQIAHVLAIAFKTGFQLSDDVLSFVRDASARCPPEDIARILERKLPQSAAKLELFWSNILSGGTKACPTPTRAVSL